LQLSSEIDLTVARITANNRNVVAEKPANKPAFHFFVIKYEQCIARHRFYACALSALLRALFFNRSAFGRFGFRRRLRSGFADFVSVLPLLIDQILDFERFASV